MVLGEGFSVADDASKESPSLPSVITRLGDIKYQLFTAASATPPDKSQMVGFLRLLRNSR